MASNKGDIVADFFCGSGVALYTAQGTRKEMDWLWYKSGCNPNINKNINFVLEEQQGNRQISHLRDVFAGSLGCKVFNVNDYDVFKNEIEAKEIVMEMYGVEPVKRTYFDGVLDKNFVKVMPLNRVLNKMDIRTLIKNVGDKVDGFTVMKKSKAGEAVYEEGVLVICSGMELDVLDLIKKRK